MASDTGMAWDAPDGALLMPNHEAYFRLWYRFNIMYLIILRNAYEAEVDVTAASMVSCTPCHGDRGGQDKGLPWSYTVR